MMKRALLASAVFICFAASAADPTVGAVPAQQRQQQAQQQQQQTNAAATSAATNQGNAQSITFTSPADTKSTIVYEGGQRVETVTSGTSTLKNTPSVNAPPLVSSNDTCMGSASGALNVPGFGVAVGKTYTDTNCVMLKNSREMWNMGMKAAALARMCMDAENRDALEMTGFVCAQTERDRRASAQTVQSARDVQRPQSDERITDPIVRARLGLAPLK